MHGHIFHLSESRVGRDNHRCEFGFRRQLINRWTFEIDHADPLTGTPRFHAHARACNPRASLGWIRIPSPIQPVSKAIGLPDFRRIAWFPHRDQIVSGFIVRR